MTIVMRIFHGKSLRKVFYARVGSIGNRTGVRSEPMRFLVQTDSLFSLSLFALHTSYSA